MDFILYMFKYHILGYFWGTKFSRFVYPKFNFHKKLFSQMTHMGTNEGVVSQRFRRINFRNKHKIAKNYYLENNLIYGRLLFFCTKICPFITSKVYKIILGLLMVMLIEIN